MTARLLGFIAVLFIASGTTASAQDAVPAHNPIFLSLAGPNAEPIVFRDVSLTTYQLLTGSVQFDKTETSAKATFAPFKLREGYRPVLSEVAFNFSQAKGITTLGAGAAYNPRSAYSKTSGDDLQSELLKMKPFRNQQPGEAEDVYQAARAAYYKTLWYDVFDRFYSILAKNAVIVSGAANVQTFGTLAGDPVDIDEDGKIDNQYNTKGYDFSGTITYSASQATGLTASAHYGKKRLSAVEGQILETYPGLSVSFAQRVKVLNPAYRQTDDYLKSLFVPSIVVGASAEWQRCRGIATTCENALESQVAFTPFVDVKISTTSQFRIGIPVQRSVTFGKKSKTALAPAVQYVVQLTGSK